VLAVKSFNLSLCPMENRKYAKYGRYRYEGYRDAWALLMPVVGEGEVR